MIHAAGHLFDDRVRHWQRIFEHGDEQQLVGLLPPCADDVVHSNHHVIILVANVVLRKVILFIDVTRLHPLQARGTVVAAARLGVEVCFEVLQRAYAIVSFRGVERGCEPFGHGRAERSE